MKFRNIVGAALCAAFALGVAPAQAQNYKSEYKLSIVVGTTFPWGQGAVIWSDLVRERTEGRINIPAGAAATAPVAERSARPPAPGTCRPAARPPSPRWTPSARARCGRKPSG
ncbi:Uncharacterised protein [Bordetella pertussis]|nr:Uncharacterised protein [Bordetella pertussis]